MKSRFLPAAITDLEAAMAFYKGNQPGLGLRFLGAFKRALRCIAKAPNRWPVLGRGIRRRLVPGFPYAVLYLTETDHVMIVAQRRQKRGHPRRRPDECP